MRIAATLRKRYSLNRRIVYGLFLFVYYEFGCMGLILHDALLKSVNEKLYQRCYFSTFFDMISPLRYGHSDILYLSGMLVYGILLTFFSLWLVRKVKVTVGKYLVFIALLLLHPVLFALYLQNIAQENMKMFVL